MQGNAILRMEVQPYGILVYDSFKYFQTPLSKLSQRFNLEEQKGFMCLSENIEAWNILKRHPPPLMAYISHRDTKDTIKKKQDWYLSFKASQDVFNFNEEMVKYC